jgi:glycosyl-4,4'-diaponeurosporenoate acyltransferase
MILHLSPWQLVVVNVLAWLVIHLGIPYVITRLPGSRFSIRRWPCRPFRRERDGRGYERHVGVRWWKDRLPDGAALFRGGFRKKHLRTRDADYLDRFLAETCRGEIAHWLVLACAILFFAWNPWPIGLLMVAYAVAANAPCILVQRYNRLRLLRLLSRAGGAPGRSPTTATGTGRRPAATPRTREA